MEEHPYDEKVQPGSPCTRFTCGDNHVFNGAVRSMVYLSNLPTFRWAGLSCVDMASAMVQAGLAILVTHHRTPLDALELCLGGILYGWDGSQQGRSTASVLFGGFHGVLRNVLITKQSQNRDPPRPANDNDSGNDPPG